LSDEATNKHGLSRHIPAEVKAEVRRRSRHGCVICRSLVYDYEHIDPEFADAREHSPSDICLLCPEHHAEVTRGRLAKSQIQAAYEKVQNSADIRPPFYQPQLSGTLTLGLGDALFENMPRNACVLEYDGTRILEVGYVEDEVFGGARPSITGSVFDITGTELLRLEDNLLTLQVDVADVQFSGRTLRIFGAARALVFEMTLTPPNGVRFTRLRMRYLDIICEMDQTFGLTLPMTNSKKGCFLVSGIRTKGARAAIAYTSDRSRWHGKELEIAGGKGICIPCSGATLALGAGVMRLPRLEMLG
jgi:hypothetical protein